MGILGFSGYARSLVILALAMVLSGCAGTGGRSADLTPAGVKRFFGVTKYYVRSTANLRNGPDRSSTVVAKLQRNTLVTETQRNDSGWSKVKTQDGSHEGWVATSLLSEEPVALSHTEGAASKKARSSVTREPVEPAGTSETEPETVTTPEVKEDAPQDAPKAGANPPPPVATPPASTEEEQPVASPPMTTPKKVEEPSGGLGPSPALGATVPETPSKTRRPGGREGAPESFEPF